MEASVCNGKGKNTRASVFCTTAVVQERHSLRGLRVPFALNKRHQMEAGTGIEPVYAELQSTA